MVLPATDGYALFLVAFFVQLNGYAELTRPRRPSAPDLRDCDEWLQNSRSAAYEEALKRWEIGYLQPWQQRKERHDKQKRAERQNTLRKRAAAGDETAMQRQDSERDRINKSKQSLRNRTSEAAAAGDETAMQRQDSERDRKRQRRDEQRSIQSDGAPFTSQLDVMMICLLYTSPSPRDS